MIINIAPGCWIDPAEVTLIEANSSSNEVIIHLKNQVGFHCKAYIQGVSDKSTIALANEIGTAIKNAQSSMSVSAVPTFDDLVNEVCGKVQNHLDRVLDRMDRS